MTIFYITTLAKAQEATFWMPQSASTLAEGVDDTFYFIYWVSIFFFIVLMGAMIWFALAYKKKGDDDRTLDLKGSHTIEIAWATLPSFLLVAMFVMGFTNYVKSTVPPADSLDIRVTGWQWDWDYTYPEQGGFKTKDLVAPNGVPVRLQMTSKDVLHSFYVPDFRIKKDVLPNRYTTQWFETTGLYDNKVYTRDNGYSDFEARELGSDSKPESVLGSSGVADIVAVVASQCAKEKEIKPNLECSTDPKNIKTGQHQVYCTEYCGDSHSRMLSKVVVLEPSDFNLWIKGMRNFNPYEKFETTAEVGEYFYTKVGCNGCHSVDGSAMTGPTWKGLYGAQRTFSNGTPSVSADENYLLKSILEPQADLVAGYENAKMNGGWEDMLSPDDMAAIIDYIKTLK